MTISATCKEAMSMCKKRISPGGKIPFKLTATERKLVLEDLMCLDEEYEQIILKRAYRQPTRLNQSTA
jgi:hypothetical protein